MLVRPTPDDVPGYLNELYKQLTLPPAAWTPVLTFATAGDLSVAYTTQFGRKKLIGNYGRAWFVIVTSTFTHTTASGNCQITGLGETALNVTNLRNFGSMVFQGITKADFTQIVPTLRPNEATILLEASGSAQTQGTVTAADMPTGGSVILRGEVLFPI